jgi:hypothetical protein
VKKRSTVFAAIIHAIRQLEHGLYADPLECFAGSDIVDRDEVLAAIAGVERERKQHRKRGYTFTTGKPGWNRKLPYPSRKMAGRIVFEIEPGRWVTRQRAWQLLKRGPARPTGRPRKDREAR